MHYSARVTINCISHNPSVRLSRNLFIHGFNRPSPAPRAQDVDGSGVREHNVVPLGQVHDTLSFNYLSLNCLFQIASFHLLCSPPQRPAHVTLTTLTSPVLLLQTQHKCITFIHTGTSCLCQHPLTECFQWL